MITRWIAIAASAFLIAGCGKKREVRRRLRQLNPAEPDSVVQPASSQSDPGFGATGSKGDTGQMLDQSTQVLRKFSVENRRVPATLDEVVAAGHLKANPAAARREKIRNRTQKSAGDSRQPMKNYFMKTHAAKFQRVFFWPRFHVD